MVQPVLNKNGYITLISIITLGSIGLSVVLFLLLAGASSSKTLILTEQSIKARSLVNACADEALQQIRTSTSFAGSGSLSLGVGTCEYLVIFLSGQDRIIQASSTVGDIIKKVRINIDAINPEINTTYWQEVGDF
jgi:hypothetical protein